MLQEFIMELLVVITTFMRLILIITLVFLRWIIQPILVPQYPHFSQEDHDTLILLEQMVFQECVEPEIALYAN